jgi:hypothetical protein
MKYISRLLLRRSWRLGPSALGTLWLVAACSSDGSPPADAESPAPIPSDGSGNVPGNGTNGTPSVTGGEGNAASGAPLDPNASGPTTSADSEWCQALGVLRQSCQGCHASEPQFGAPMPLVSFGDLQASSVSDAAQTVAQRVQARIHDAQRPMPPRVSPASMPGWPRAPRRAAIRPARAWHRRPRRWKPPTSSGRRIARSFSR